MSDLKRVATVLPTPRISNVCAATTLYFGCNNIFQWIIYWFSSPSSLAWVLLPLSCTKPTLNFFFHTCIRISLPTITCWPSLSGCWFWPKVYLRVTMAIDWLVSPKPSNRRVTCSAWWRNHFVSMVERQSVVI